jgi:hypothetical protein
MPKGTVSRDFCFRFFSRIIFPQSPENNNRAISNFFEISQRYSQVKVHHPYQRHRRWQIMGKISGLLTYTLSEIRNGPNWIPRGLGETDSWKKTGKTKISWHCPLNNNLYMKATSSHWTVYTAENLIRLLCFQRSKLEQGRLQIWKPFAKYKLMIYFIALQNQFIWWLNPFKRLLVSVGPPYMTRPWTW